MNTNYQSIFGFTIGPIYEMMRSAKKTRELWFSSYFFSWYAKLFCDKLTSDYKLILPIIDKIKLPKRPRAGFYPDHIIGYSSKPVEDTKKELEDWANQITNDFAKWIDELITIEKLPKMGGSKSVLEIINAYLQTSIVVINKDGINDDLTALNTIEDLLFACEKNRNYSLGENKQTCYRCKSLSSVVKVEETFDKPDKEYNLCPLCFFKLRAHKSTELLKLVNFRKKKPYPPIAYITTKDLHEIKEYVEINKKLFTGEAEDLEKKYFKRHVNGKEVCDLKTHHKYLAIVYADGDDLGKILSQKKNPSLLSKKLSEFSIEAYKIGAKYGVEPIYLGGDDLLVFMPVVYKERTIFDYIIELQKLYTKIVTIDELTPSISFGVGITYYKYPLSIALDDTRDLLFITAKNIPGKNSLVLQLTQHSGAKTRINFSFSDDTITIFNKFLTEVLQSEKSGKKIHPHAVHHKLSYFKTLLTNVNNVEQIHEFFLNQFNEPIHKTMDGLTIVKTLLIENISSKNDKGETILYPKKELEKGFKNFLGQIKFIKFLIGE